MCSETYKVNFTIPHIKQGQKITNRTNAKHIRLSKGTLRRGSQLEEYSSTLQDQNFPVKLLD